MLTPPNRCNLVALCTNRNLLFRWVTEQSSTAEPDSAVYLRRIAGTNGTCNQAGTLQSKSDQDCFMIRLRSIVTGDILPAENLAFTLSR
jgi:hypothetical protein